MRLEAAPLAAANGWLEGYRRIWDANFGRLDTLLDELPTSGAAKPTPDAG